MARVKDDWKNEFTYEGWILDVEGPIRRPDGLFTYKLTVGFSSDEQIRVLAFRRAPSQRLVRGNACRVRGHFRFIPDDLGRVQRKLNAVEVKVMDPPDPDPRPRKRP